MNIDNKSFGQMHRSRCCSDQSTDISEYFCEENHEMTSFASITSTGDTKVRWADLADSEEEFDGATMEVEQSMSRMSQKSSGEVSAARYDLRTRSSPRSSPRRASSRGRGRATARKLQCQYFIGIKEEPSFRVVRHILGPAGAHVKDIVGMTGAKLRLRGAGSKFLEGPEQLESEDELMLCISCETVEGYQLAKELVQQHLKNIYERYHAFCTQTGKPESPLSIRMHEGAREGSR